MMTDRTIEKKAFICILPYFNFGGASTLYYRMLKWSKRNGYCPILFVKREFDFKEGWIKDLEDNHINYLFYKERLGRYHYQTDSGKKPLYPNAVIQNTEFDSVICVVSNMFEYFTAIDLKRRIRADSFQIVFYTIHPMDVGYTRWKTVNSLYYSLFLRKVFLSGNLVFMDEETRDTYVRRYGGEKNSMRIIRQGMEISAWRDERLEQKKEKPVFEILSICRMEFPFKGYVLGLIDDFAKLRQMGLEVKLTLIGDGHDMPAVKKKIAGLERRTRDSIQLTGDVAYTELNQYLGRAHVLVGMGTTVLDGAGAGLPCVIATSYQTDNYSCGLFHEMPHVIGYVLGEAGSMNSRIIDDILRVYRMSPDQYMNLCRETYQAYCGLYDIDNNMREFVKTEGKSVGISWPAATFFKGIRFLVYIKNCVRRKLCM